MTHEEWQNLQPEDIVISNGRNSLFRIGQHLTIIRSAGLRLEDKGHNFLQRNAYTVIYNSVNEFSLRTTIDAYPWYDKLNTTIDSGINRFNKIEGLID